MATPTAKIGANVRIVLNLTIHTTGDSESDSQAIRDAAGNQLASGINPEEVSEIEIVDSWRE